MRINRWPQGDFDLEPGDMVRITAGDLDGVWAEVAIAAGEAERSPSWIPAGAGPAMYIGPTGEEDAARGAQVLHEGRILNVPTTHLRPDV